MKSKHLLAGALGAALVGVALVAGCGSDDTPDDGLGTPDASASASATVEGDNLSPGVTASTTSTATATGTAEGAGTATATSSGTPAPTPTPVQSAIVDGQLEDAEIVPGTTIIWTNQDAEAHTITSANSTGAALDSGEIEPGGTFEHTFNEAGVWELVVDDGTDIWVVTVA